MPAARSTRRSPRNAGPEPHVLEAIEPRFLLAVTPLAVANTHDQVSVVVVEDGSPLLFDQQSDGSWERQDFASWISADSSFSTSSATWRDPKDGATYFAFNGPNNLWLILDDDAGRRESVRSLTAEIDGAQPIASNITAFTSIDGIVHIAGLSADGDVVLYRQTGGRAANGDYLWEFINISQEHLAPQGQATPAFTGRLCSFVTAWNALNIAGLDENGDVQTVWWAPGLEHWQTSNLSEQTGAPTLAGSVSVYLTSWGGINIAGIRGDGAVVVTWWVPEFGGDWALTDFSESFGGPQFVAGTVMAYTTPWGGLNVGGVTAAGGLAIYWWVPEFGGNWQIASDLVPGADDFSADGVYGFTSPAGTINLVGSNDTGQVIRCSWQPGAAWQFENIQSQAVEVDDELDDHMGPVVPALQPLAGAWQVTLTSTLMGVPDDLGDDVTPGLMALRADGAWFNDEADVADLWFLGGAGLVGGTWTYSGGIVTLTIPQVGSTSSGRISSSATEFTTHGISLTAAAKLQFEQTIDQLDAQSPDLHIRQQINSLGGITAILNSIELHWVRA